MVDYHIYPRKDVVKEGMLKHSYPRKDVVKEIFAVYLFSGRMW
jgi:hypothetical protein